MKIKLIESICNYFAEKRNINDKKVKSLYFLDNFMSDFNNPQVRHHNRHRISGCRYKNQFIR